MAEDVCQILGDVCVFYCMEATTFQQESTEIFSFFAWMANPDLLLRSKVVTFLSNKAGWATASHGPPPADALHPLLIHLDHYNDWNPQSADSSSSSGMGSHRYSLVLQTTLSQSTRASRGFLESKMASRWCGRRGRGCSSRAACRQGAEMRTLMMVARVVVTDASIFMPVGVLMTISATEKRTNEHDRRSGDHRHCGAQDDGGFST
jgi:hypothetical protein